MKKQISKLKYFLPGLVIAFLLAGCLIPDNGYLMELNRTGKWAEAEKVGLEMLRNGDRFTHSQRCETYFHVIYAKTRMGKKEEAIDMMDKFDSYKMKGIIDSELLWLSRETEILRNELGIADEIQRTILTAMEKNGQGEYTAARELCVEALSMSGINDVQKAAAGFVASVCSVRLKELEEAEKYYAVFLTSRDSLPEGHQIFREEQYLIDDIEELKKR